MFVGRATRGVEFFEHAEKTYETVLRLGLTTDTEDITGTVLAEAPVSFTEEQLTKTLEAFAEQISSGTYAKANKKGKIMSQVNNEIYAAISMALYELQGAMMHDDEPGIITIKPRQTAWKTPQQIILSR